VKYFKRFLIIFFIFLLVIAIFLKPAVVFIVKEQIKKLLPGTSVIVTGCSLNPFRRFTPLEIPHCGKPFLMGPVLTGIRISRLPEYDCKINSVEVNFSPASILKGLTGKPWEIIESCRFNLDFLAAKDARIESGYLKVTRLRDDGVVLVRLAKLGKLNLRDIQGKVSLQDEYLILDSLSARILGGFLHGRCQINFSGPLRYQADLNFVNLDLDTLTKDFAFDEQVVLSGKVSGFLKLRGQMEKFEIIDGNLTAGEEGGTLTIKDRKFLENIARGSGQAMDLVVESFQNYRYNTGITTVSLQDNNAVFFINLDGKTGKRVLNIILRDFNAKSLN